MSPVLIFIIFYIFFYDIFHNVRLNCLYTQVSTYDAMYGREYAIRNHRTYAISCTLLNIIYYILTDVYFNKQIHLIHLLIRMCWFITFTYILNLLLRYIHVLINWNFSFIWNDIIFINRSRNFFLIFSLLPFLFFTFISHFFWSFFFFYCF